MNLDVPADGRFEIVNAGKNTPVQRLSFQLAKPAFHRIQPRGTGRGEVKLKTRRSLQPGFYFGCFMGRTVVQNQVEVLLLRNFTVDLS